MQQFVTIDEQGWYSHFWTSYRGWLYRPSHWFLSLLRRSPWVAMINTYGVHDGKAAHDLDKRRLEGEND